MRMFKQYFTVRVVTVIDRLSSRSSVFQGLALDKKNQYEESEKAYDAATKIKGDDALAWQGLITLYEKQAGQKLNEYHNAAIHLAELFMEEYVD